MKKILALLSAMMLTGCSGTENSENAIPTTQPVTAYIQEEEQLHIDEETGYAPLNYTGQAAIWLPYTLFGEIMLGKTEEQFRSAISEKLSEAQAENINTVYFHAHPFGDAYYNSDIFPRGGYLDAEYDPLAIVIEEAHSRDISVHAWINPLRCQTEEELADLPDDFIIKNWISDPECRSALSVNGRVYLNPANDTAVELICSCADEILSRYDVDGIHIDDYFYPTDDPEFDRPEFEASGCSDLTQWRLDNCSRFVKALYDTVKSHGSRLVFGISPQGNINSDYSTQYADVRRWCSEEGFCDYIVPQIYFGFKNEACPFEETLHEWEQLTRGSSVSLVVGLAAYKLGKEDKWAGDAGKLEWIEDPDIIEKQTALVNNSTADGYALYY